VESKQLGEPLPCREMRHDAEGKNKTRRGGLRAVRKKKAKKGGDKSRGAGIKTS